MEYFIGNQSIIKFSKINIVIINFIEGKPHPEDEIIVQTQNNEIKILNPHDRELFLKKFKEYIAAEEVNQ